MKGTLLIGIVVIGITLVGCGSSNDGPASPLDEQLTAVAELPTVGSVIAASSARYTITYDWRRGVQGDIQRSVLRRYDSRIRLDSLVGDGVMARGWFAELQIDGKTLRVTISCSWGAAVSSDDVEVKCADGELSPIARALVNNWNRAARRSGSTTLATGVGQCYGFTGSGEICVADDNGELLRFYGAASSFDGVAEQLDATLLGGVPDLRAISEYGLAQGSETVKSLSALDIPVVTPRDS